MQWHPWTGLLAAALTIPGPAAGQRRDAQPLPDTSARERARLAWPAVAGALQALSNAEAAFHAAHGSFTTVMSDLAWAGPSGGAQVRVLWADSAGWRAIATGEPTDFLCAAAVGPAAVAFHAVAADGIPVCGWPPDSLGSTPPPAPNPQEPVREVRPESRCPRLALTREAQRRIGTTQTVTVTLTIDATGHPEKSWVTIHGGTTLWTTIAALDVIERCRYRPASVNGRRVRVLVVQPITLHP